MPRRRRTLLVIGKVRLHISPQMPPSLHQPASGRHAFSRKPLNGTGYIRICNQGIGQRQPVLHRLGHPGAKVRPCHKSRIANQGDTAKSHAGRF